MTHVEKLQKTAQRIRSLAKDCDQLVYAQKLAETARELEQHAAELERCNKAHIAFL